MRKRRTFFMFFGITLLKFNGGCKDWNDFLFSFHVSTSSNLATFFAVSSSTPALAFRWRFNDADDSEDEDVVDDDEDDDEDGAVTYCWWLAAAARCAAAAAAVAAVVDPEPAFERWKWTLSHRLSRRCQTRVSSVWLECAIPYLNKHIFVIGFISALEIKISYLSTVCRTLT